MTSLNVPSRVRIKVGTFATLLPSTSKPKYSIKCPNPLKYVFGVLVSNAYAVDQWLGRWEQTFQMCEIIDDETCIERAPFNL